MSEKMFVPETLVGLSSREAETLAETVCLLGPGTGNALSLQNHWLALMTLNVDSRLLREYTGLM